MTVVDFAELVDEAIYTKLTTTPGTTLYALRVYDSQAPQGTTFPYVIFSQIAGGNDNLTPNDSNDLVYRIEGIAADAYTAAQVNGYIQQAMGSIQYSLNVSGYTNYSTQRQQAFRRIDNIGGTQFYRRGDNYRIRYDAGS